MIVGVYDKNSNAMRQWRAKNEADDDDDNSDDRVSSDDNKPRNYMHERQKHDDGIGRTRITSTGRQ